MTHVPLPQFLVDEGPEVSCAEVPRAGRESHQPSSLRLPVYKQKSVVDPGFPVAGRGC